MDKLQAIRLLLLDVDGVLTDGRLGFTETGQEIKFFSVRDGFGIRRWIDSGREIAFLSGRSGGAVRKRAQELGVRHSILGSNDKMSDLKRLLGKLRLGPHETAAMGDDIPDLPILSYCGFSAAPVDAAREVREQVDHICRMGGGRGAVREVIDLIMNAQDTPRSSDPTP